MSTFHGMSDTSRFHNQAPSQPTSPTQPMSPNTAASTHVFNETTANKPYGKEWGQTGAVSPGGKHFEAGYPIQGNSHSVDFNRYSVPTDTRFNHSHPTAQGGPPEPSGVDHYNGYVGKNSNPQQQHMIRNTPQSNQSGEWMKVTGSLNGQGQARWHNETNPYNMKPVEHMPGVGYRTEIPTNADLRGGGVALGGGSPSGAPTSPIE